MWMYSMCIVLCVCVCVYWMRVIKFLNHLNHKKLRKIALDGWKQLWETYSPLQLGSGAFLNYCNLLLVHFYKGQCKLLCVIRAKGWEGDTWYSRWFFFFSCPFLLPISSSRESCSGYWKLWCGYDLGCLFR